MLLGVLHIWRKSIAPSKPPPQPPLPDPQYLQIEGFIELSGSGDIDASSGTLKVILSGLKGPRADQGKGGKGIARTEEPSSNTFLKSAKSFAREPQTPRKDGGKLNVLPRGGDNFLGCLGESPRP